MSDGQLLSRYVGSRDESAFEALVRRHGPMVLGVCRRLLRDRHEAEDAFQATFLVLVRKAASVAPAEMLPNWLHGVARQTAVRARSAAAKRGSRERQVADLPETAARPPEPAGELRALLDDEIARLPGKNRVAVVLCLLEGLTHQEAARHLGWPVGTLASRLSRAKRMLARRLAGRGVTPSGGALAALTSIDAPARVPASLVSSTAQAGSLCGSGQAAAGAVPPEVAALAEGVLKAMWRNRAKAVAAVLLMAGMAALGGGLLTHRTAAADQPPGEKRDEASRPAPRPRPRPAEKPAPAAAAKPATGSLQIAVEGRRLRVRGDCAGAPIDAVADRVFCDEEKDRLFLEATGDGKVSLRWGEGEKPEIIEGKKVIIHRKTGERQIIGAGKIDPAVPGPAGLGVAVPM